MSWFDTPQPGKVGWMDLTVANAEVVRDFYRAVAGWDPQPLDMGGYNDFVMAAPDGSAAAGICHARGVNADIPPCWLVYITVADLPAALDAVRAEGGAVVAGPKGEPGRGRYAIIRDPAGVHSALYEAPAR